jgi:hypothetical protein
MMTFESLIVGIGILPSLALMGACLYGWWHFNRSEFR